MNSVLNERTHTLQLANGLHQYANRWLQDILGYWVQNTQDENFGGFKGKIDDHNNVDDFADKGSVLNTRILWTFSAAYKYSHDPIHLALAQRANEYLQNHFHDATHGGIYWTVDYKGNPKDTKKQVYAVAFWLYALSEFYTLSQDEAILMQCRELYWLIEHHAFDKEHKGYFEAFSRDWKNLGDMRLSDKDANEPKTMNTHLHILEAYTNLYRIWPNKELKTSIKLLIHNFQDHILDPVTHHLKLFFTEKWLAKHSGTISYGHDIEATWLVQEAAEVIRDKKMIEKWKETALDVADAVREGIDEKDNGLWYEKQGETLVGEKHWWPQAEGLVGFVNAWQVSGEKKYLESAAGIADFIEQKILNRNYGEWHWGVDANGLPLLGFDKAGLWKCPYHNGRACLELLKRTAPEF